MVVSVSLKSAFNSDSTVLLLGVSLPFAALSLSSKLCHVGESPKHSENLGELGHSRVPDLVIPGCIGKLDRNNTDKLTPFDEFCIV